MISNCLGEVAVVYSQPDHSPKLVKRDSPSKNLGCEAKQSEDKHKEEHNRMNREDILQQEDGRTLEKWPKSAISQHSGTATSHLMSN